MVGGDASFHDELLLCGLPYFNDAVVLAVMFDVAAAADEHIAY